MFKIARAKNFLIIAITVTFCMDVVFFSRAQNSNYVNYSHGLGLSQEEWEGIYGIAEKRDSAQSVYATKQERFIVSFREDRVSYLNFKFRTAVAMSLVSARDVSRKYIPSDSVFVKIEDALSGPDYEVYYSASLKSRFGEREWIGGEPGNFIVEYFPDSDSVEHFIIGIGINP